MTVHRQLTRDEHRAVSEAARRGASFDRPEMACRTGDGHAKGSETWAAVTCPACLAKRPQVVEIERTERARFTYPETYPGAGVGDNAPGELLTMSDGERWFHPYRGSAPVKITDQNRPGLSVG